MMKAYQSGTPPKKKKTKNKSWPFCQLKIVACHSCESHGHKEKATGRLRTSQNPCKSNFTNFTEFHSGQFVFTTFNEISREFHIDTWHTFWPIVLFLNISWLLFPQSWPTRSVWINKGSTGTTFFHSTTERSAASSAVSVAN